MDIFDTRTGATIGVVNRNPRTKDDTPLTEDDRVFLEWMFSLIFGEGNIALENR